MDSFIGESAGILMILLMVLLFWKLLSDTISDKIGDFFKKYKKVMITALLLGVFQMMIGALVVTLFRGKIGVFDLLGIWKMDWLKNDFQYWDNFSCQELLLNGRFPLYYVVVYLLSKVLFNAIKQSALYVGLMAGITTFTSLFIIISKHVDSKEKGMLNDMIWCLPGSFFFFLPSSFSLCIAFMSVFFLTWQQEKKNKLLSLALALLCASTHIIGILPIYVMIAYKIFHEGKIGYYISLCILAVLLILFGIKGYLSHYEIILPIEIVTYSFLMKKKIKVSLELQMYLTLFMVITNGFWMMISVNIL